MSQKTVRLKDVREPKLYRETFPYTEFPRVLFTQERVPMEIPESIWVTDTTFRDGQQARPPYTPEQILRIYDLLHAIDQLQLTGVLQRLEILGAEASLVALGRVMGPTPLLLLHPVMSLGKGRHRPLIALTDGAAGVIEMKVAQHHVRDRFGRDAGRRHLRHQLAWLTIDGEYRTVLLTPPVP